MKAHRWSVINPCEYQCKRLKETDSNTDRKPRQLLTGGAEGPAGTAHSLVLDRRHGAVLHPVHGVRRMCDVGVTEARLCAGNSVDQLTYLVCAAFCVPDVVGSASSELQHGSTNCAARCRVSSQDHTRRPLAQGTGLRRVHAQVRRGKLLPRQVRKLVQRHLHDTLDVISWHPAISTIS